MRKVRRGGGFDVLENVMEGPRDHARVALATLHRVCLAGACLAIREHAPVESVQH